MIDKIRNSIWLDWVIAVLTALIISYVLSMLGNLLNTSPGVAGFIPHPYPGTQMVAFETIRSIDAFSGDATNLMNHWDRFINIAFSLVFIFIISPLIFIKGIIQSEKKNKTTALWYLGAASMLTVTTLPIITNYVAASVFSDTKEKAAVSAHKDKLRSKLISSAFKTSENVFKLDEISNIGNLNADQLFVTVNESYDYFMHVSLEDTSVNLAIVSSKDSWQTDVKNLNGKTGKLQENITVYPFRKDLLKTHMQTLDVDWKKIE